MSEQSLENEKTAYIKYDKLLGSLLEVALHNRLTIDDTTAIFEVPRSICMQFLKGEQKVTNFVVAKNEEGKLALLPKTHKRFNRSFWELCLINNEYSPFELIDLQPDNFTIKLKSDVTMGDAILLYVTEKNDPNCLQQTIKFLKTDFEKSRVVTIEVDYKDEYDVYVRNYAA